MKTPFIIPIQQPCPSIACRNGIQRRRGVWVWGRPVEVCEAEAGKVGTRAGGRTAAE